MARSEAKWVSLGDYIIPIDRRNTGYILGVDSVRGVSNTKEIMATKASVDEKVIDKFLLIYPNEFVYNPRTTRMGEKIGLVYNNTQEPLLFTFNNLAFAIKEECKSLLLPDYLYLFFNRAGFDRYSRVNSWGSATELFPFSEMQRVKIPLPSIEKQREIVAEWKGLRDMKDQNEQIAQPLMELCQSFIEEGKKQYSVISLCDYIEQSDLRNNQVGLMSESVRGISVEKKIISTKADMTNVPVASYKIFDPEEFCFVPVTSRNGDRISISINDSEERFIVSGTYEVFRIKDKNKLLPSYLSLWFSRPEFDRYARFNSWGSAREAFGFEEMCRVRIPLPPIAVQQAIVNIYKSAQEAKKIAEEADKLSNEICPALIQHVIHC